MLTAVAATFSLFSCINNDYDLSDLDTTVGVNVKDLSIPVQMDEITLKSMLDLEEGSQIKEINGLYAVVEDGTFESEKINISSFWISKPVVEPIDDVINVKNEYYDDVTEIVEEIPDRTVVFSFDLSKTGYTDVHFETDDVDKSIVSIDNIDFGTKTGDFVELTMSLKFGGIEKIADGFEIDSLEIQLPKGLQFINLRDGAEYYAESGLLSYPEDLPLSSTSENVKVIVLDLVGIDNKVPGEEPVIVLEKDEKTGKQGFRFSSECGVKKGSVKIYGGHLKDKKDHSILQTVKKVDYHCNIEFSSDIEVKSFSGEIQYEVEGIDVDPVSMKDIPDVLNQTGTNIELGNPQIYIQLNNPLYNEYQVYAETGLELVSHHEKEEPKSFASSSIKVDSPLNQFCLSPEKPDTYYDSNAIGGDLIPIDFKDAEWCVFNDLGKVLSGQKLPQSIDINVVDPKIPVQNVKDFSLGQDIDPIVGTYVFYAPLALTDKSHIAYSDTIDGWNDEDIDAITITGLTVDAAADSDVPLKLNLEVFPIDVNGDKIEGVTGYAEIPANAENVPITVKVEGKIQHLDGIILKATVGVANGNTTPLKPGQHIKLNNLKAKVSGNYIKEL